MRLFAFSSLVVLICALSGCVTTTGEIKENRFYVEHDFSVGLLDNEWQVTRQKINPLIAANAAFPRENTPWAISFAHKKSNGFIAVSSSALTELGQARSLEIWADNIVASSGGLKLAGRSIKIDGNDALELVVSGKYMTKQIILKKGKRAYRVVYANSPAYFDQYLSVFDGFVETLRLQ